VRAECLQFAIDNYVTDGIYGGLGPHERRALWPADMPARRRQRADAAPCGTESGYTRHRRWGQAACPSCLAAATRASQARRAARERAKVKAGA